MGFTHVTRLGHMTGFTSFDLFWYMAQLTHKSQMMDFELRHIMSHELCDTEYESQRVRVGGRTLDKRGALGRQGVATNHLFYTSGD